MPKLYELSKLVRSKNAGPFVVTIDIILKDGEIYQKIKESKQLCPELFSKIYSIPLDDIHFVHVDHINTFKVSFPRPIVSGGLGDSDVYACQQHGPLVELEIDI